ncbi:hypothetical protein P879_09154 [Paragonimus westermani]|uniref:non-specific serine/threonine protein kinase n=1 Tax=Paragonimus westermani TaxID=34504 RepID=A0A8T0DLN1_9TREM|nr:hypothetical protein P879_09154 [Paragonimus westermani]
MKAVEHLLPNLEGYEIIEKLGCGAQGVSYKLKSNGDERLFVLKMIECRDVTHGELIFEELLRLRDVKHAYVPTILEAFMSMDNGNSAVYLSVIRPYITALSMKEVLQKHFQKKSIERSLVYHAFGCVLDVLIHLKSCGYSHMNLHPNNVFISNNKAFVTDAWCPTLVSYARGMDFCDLCKCKLAFGV